MAAAIAFAERVSLWREELQRLVVDARLLRPEARRAVGSVLRSLLLEDCGDPEEINALRTAIEVFDTPPATPAKRPPSERPSQMERIRARASATA